MNSIILDLRYGVRMMFRNPVFTLIAVVTLALGIGANTAILLLRSKGQEQSFCRLPEE